jgi:uroporphyrinogen decarboxylase
MKPKDRIINALERREPDYVPVFEWDYNKDVMKAITGSDETLDFIVKMDIDGVVIRPNYHKEFIDKNVYIDEWGCRRKKASESIAVIIDSPIKKIKDQKNYTFPDPYAAHRFESLEKAVKKFGDERAVVLNVRDVFSDIRDLLGYEETLVSLITEQGHFEKLLDRVIEYNRAIAEIACERYNINILATTDDIADTRGLIFNPRIFFDFLGPRFRDVIKGFHDIGYYCVKHTDGNIMDILDYLIESGIDCIDPIDPTANMDIGFIKKKYGDKVCIKGNVNCVTTLVSGSTGDVEKNVKNCIKNAGYGGGYILSSSNTIHSGVKPDNFIAMMNATRRYGKYPINL